MNVLIVAPKVTQKPGEFYHFPLGLGYISSTLKRHGHRVSCLNCNGTTEDPQALVERTVGELSPDAIATGSLSPFLPQVRGIFEAARRAKSEIITIAGGGVLSSDPEAAPSVMDIDVGVIGEGEATIADLCDALERGRDLNTVPGIVFVDRKASCPTGLSAAGVGVGVGAPLRGGNVVRTASRDAIDDLGSVPWPDYDGFGFDEIIGLQRTKDNYFFHADDRPRAIDMITSRSCPYRCTFCFHPTGKIYRERPLDDFFAELDHVVPRYGITKVALIDELFSLKKKRLLEFCERIAPYGLQWMVQLHVNVADDAILQAMADAGCTYISYGVESMSPSVLLSMQKGSRVERIDDVLARTYEKHIGIQGNLIFGDTAESLPTANESMDWWAKHRHFMINVNRLQVYPGSPDYIEAVRDGLITDRTKFIDELDIDLNISKLNDDDLRMISLLTGTSQKTLLNIAPIVSFEPDVDEFFETSYRIVWDCPRCARRNDFRNVIPDNADRRSIRLSCRSCRARFDLENRARVPFAERPERAANDAVLAAATEAIAAGAVDAGVRRLHELVETSVWYHPAQTALARHYLARCEAAAELSTPDEMATVLHFGLAVLENPFEPDLQVDFARALMRRGAHGMARLHVEQALDLDPAHAAADTTLRALDDSANDPASRRVYFPSFSEAAAPARVQPEGYVRPKREKEFPDIAAIEREVRERMQATAV